MAIPKFKPLANASEGTKKIIKPVLAVILVILAGAFGLEASNKDWDINSILSGKSTSQSEILRDEKGNLQQDEQGNFITRIMRDIEGNEVKSGGKYTDEYNCNDFKTQPEAQKFYLKAGGVRKDTNRLDGDKDGTACEDLPQK
ncbi:hypothetical protein A2Y99_05225 [Candidatus Gottesmanbacteria bacterium RBG_13_37_7]|uniref:Excalibur calcium-binding domain-containing protein n=1 Tax=Candidatus Gottesmanbacteria bacterium RBG_13_37_7 TaxID=1798369 RepID=A0A1F5YKM4_9BACT|nr:MAG: hypothetical protein A2Y99_05225 [Candidatus Gottesmanbacteria bacterium RBG_13_37_7]